MSKLDDMKNTGELVSMDPRLSVVGGGSPPMLYRLTLDAPVPDGYEPAEDPHYLVVEYPACRFRESRRRKTKCCGIQQQQWCTLRRCTASRSRCAACDAAET